MDKLKLISVRIDPATLDAIDRLAKKHGYWKRNTIINHLLSVLLKEFDDKSLYDMLRRPLFEREPIRAEYRILQVKRPAAVKDTSVSNTNTDSDKIEDDILLG